MDPETLIRAGLGTSAPADLPIQQCLFDAALRSNGVATVRKATGSKLKLAYLRVNPPYYSPRLMTDIR